MFDLHKIYSNLQEMHIQDMHIELFDEIDSTNAYLMRKIDACDNKSVVIAESQTQGRGRNNKTWNSRIFKDITFSICYSLSIDKQNIHLIPLVIAIAVTNTLDFFNIKSYIKWPNDILDESKNKICGILVESKNINNASKVVIGVGFDNNGNLDRNILISKLIYCIDNVMNTFIQHGFKDLKSFWMQKCIHINKNIKISKDGAIIDAGINTTIDEYGMIVINDCRKYSSDVSIVI